MPRHATGTKAILHSLFELQDRGREEDFRVAFDDYVRHLVEAGYALGGRLMQRNWAKAA